MRSTKSLLINSLQRELDLLEKKKLLVAVSGGADSVALFHLLLEAGFSNLVIAHFNHHLRGASSSADARFVERLAAIHSLPFELGAAKVRLLAKEQKLSLETAARQARYSFLASVAKKHRSRRILIAHHADDQIETCFFHFLRGSGAAGLSGMSTLSESVIEGMRVQLYRPLLGISKAQLLDYLTEQKIKYRQDVSNAIPDTSRNKLRLHVLPLIEKLFGSSFQHAIRRSALIFADEEAYLSALTLPLAAKKELSVSSLCDLHPALRRRTIHAWLKNQGINEPGFAEVERVLSLLDFDEKGIGTAKINLPENRHARRRAGMIFIS